MSTTTFTVTVVSTGGGNKYFINGVQQATVNLAANATYRFDQSDSSNGSGIGHPLLLSTTSDGTHSGGSVYNTGVTINGTPGSPGAYTEIVVAADAPNLYYFCQYHPAMGGSALVTNDSWGALAWNVNSWGNQDEATITLSGLSATTSVGTLEAFNETGWGADTWGLEGWGNPPSIIPLPALSLSATVNLPADNVASFPGWGTQTWGQNSWGDVTSHTFTLTGLSTLTSSTGVLEPEDVIGITGISATASVNSFALVSTDATFTLAGLTATASEGLIVLDDHSVGLGQLSATVTVGTLDPDDLALGISGIQAQTTLGNITISSEPVILLDTPTGLTSTLGTVEADPVSGAVLSGLSATITRGNVTTTQVSNAILTGLSASTTLNDTKLILKYYGRLSPKTSSGYTRRNPKTSTGYSRKTPA